MIVAAAGLLLWTAAIEARLVYLQVIKHEELSARAERQQMQTIDVPAKRGEVLDRGGRVLAYSVDADSVYAVPTEIDDGAATAAAICGAFGDCTSKERQSLVEKFDLRRPFVYVRRKVTPEQARRVAALDLEGVGFRKEDRRFYPNKDLASHVVGYVGTDNEGLGGIEATYDKLIKGQPGRILVQTDARRHVFSRIERPPTTGASLELTIDQFLQHVAERELKAGVEHAGAAAGSAVVMDPKTGEILAIASYPTFNPNTYRDFPDDKRRFRAIQDLYEPGSTFKIVTAGAALENHLFAPDEMINTSPGVIRFGSRVIDEAKGHNYGTLSFADVIVKSSNVGAIKIGLRVGPERLTEYVRRFGFGKPLSPDFRGESPGIDWSAAKLTDSAVASVSMGYQVGVTPLQVATAFSVVANGGELVQPRVVRAVIKGGERVPVPRKVLGRVINRETAAELTSIMERVVADEIGTGGNARVEGFAIAGKTGTASKVVDGRYSQSDYNVSFAGFVPARDPEFAIVVMVDSPHKVSPYGGTVAAPIFQKIAQAALRHQGVAPTLNAPPPLLVARHDASRDTVSPRTASPGTASPGTYRPSAAAQPAIVPIRSASTGSASVFPDLRGLGARDALKTVAKLGLTVRMHGAGFVVEQEPDPGTPIERGGESTLWLQREPALASIRQP